MYSTASSAAFFLWPEVCRIALGRYPRACCAPGASRPR
jgi:hypothetical protein